LGLSFTATRFSDTSVSPGLNYALISFLIKVIAFWQTAALNTKNLFVFKKYFA